MATGAGWDRIEQGEPVSVIAMIAERERCEARSRQRPDAIVVCLYLHRLRNFSCWRAGAEFTLPAAAARLLMALSSIGLVGDDEAMLALWETDPRYILSDGDNIPDTWVGSYKVAMHKLKHKLKPYGVVVENEWGRGHRLRHEVEKTA